MKLVHGWGINDSDYVVRPTVKGEQVWCPFYKAWSSMIERCHSHKFQKRNITYVGCEVSAEWRSFAAFRAWMEKQDWKDKQLDKDILGDKLYSPGTCLFVEGWLNNLFTDCQASRGKYPVGVTFNRSQYQARFRVSSNSKFLGRFDTPEEAYSAYCRAKLEHVQELVSDYPDQRIKQAVLDKAQTLYGDYHVCC